MTTLPEFAMWALCGTVAGLAGLVIWLFKDHFALKVQLAEQQQRFVTWEYVRQLEEWRNATSREFVEVRKELQGLAISLARMETTRSSTGG